MNPTGADDRLLPRALRSVGTKLAGATLAILGLVTTVVFLYTSRIERERVLSAKEDTGVVVTSLFAQGVQASVAFDDAKGVEEQVTLFLSAPSVVQASVFGLDPLGAPMALGASAREPMEAGFDLSATRALAGGVQRGRGQILVQAPVRSAGGSPVGFTRVVFSLSEENAAIARAEHGALSSAVALGLGLAVVLIALTRSLIVRRLAALASAARRLQRGERAAVSVGGNDEVGALANAFRSMTAAIESREEEISRRNQDLRRVLDNVDAGFLTVDRAGRMSAERSRMVETWFGPAGGDDFFAWVATFDPVAAHSIRIGWQDIADDFLPLEVILDQLPKRVAVEARVFAFGYSPILDQEVLAGVVVSITDVTAEVERAAAQRAQREAMAIFRRLLDDRAAFGRFLAEGERLVAAISDEASTGEALRRALHTLKGNSAIYELESVSTACHDAESRLAEEGGESLSTEIRGTVTAAWATIRGIVLDLGGAGDAALSVSAREHAALLAAVRSGVPAAEVERRILDLGREPARVSLTRVAEQARAIARRLGKEDVAITVATSPPELRLDEEVWQPIWLAVPHLLRNALDHGIEDAETRRASGKAPGGEVRLALVGAEDGASVSLVVADDGAGVDWPKVRAAAERRGLPTETEEELVLALFADRVTTRDHVTETSGRGVGTTAVRAAVHAAGGRVRVASEHGRGTTFTLEIPVGAAGKALYRAA